MHQRVTTWPFFSSVLTRALPLACLSWSNHPLCALTSSRVKNGQAEGLSSQALASTHVASHISSRVAKAGKHRSGVRNYRIRLA